MTFTRREPQFHTLCFVGWADGATIAASSNDLNRSDKYRMQVGSMGAPIRFGVQSFARWRLESWQSTRPVHGMDIVYLGPSGR